MPFDLDDMKYPGEADRYVEKFPSVFEESYSGDFERKFVRKTFAAYDDDLKVYWSIPRPDEEVLGVPIVMFGENAPEDERADQLGRFANVLNGFPVEPENPGKSPDSFVGSGSWNYDDPTHFLKYLDRVFDNVTTVEDYFYLDIPAELENREKTPMHNILAGFALPDEEILSIGSTVRPYEILFQEDSSHRVHGEFPGNDLGDYVQQVIETIDEEIEAEALEFLRLKEIPEPVREDLESFEKEIFGEENPDPEEADYKYET